MYHQSITLVLKQRTYYSYWQLHICTIFKFIDGLIESFVSRIASNLLCGWDDLILLILSQPPEFLDHWCIPTISSLHGGGDGTQRFTLAKQAVSQLVCSLRPVPCSVFIGYFT